MNKITRIFFPKRRALLSAVLTIFLLFTSATLSLSTMFTAQAAAEPDWAAGTTVTPALTQTGLQAAITGAANTVPTTILITGDITFATATTITVPANKIIRIMGDSTKRTVSANGLNCTVVTVASGAVLYLENIKITGAVRSGNGGGVYSSGTLALNTGTEITGNKASYGAGLYATGSFTMNGGAVSGNTATAFGGGMYLITGTFEMLGGEISDNHATGAGTSIRSGLGGGVAVLGASTFNMRGGKITGNTSNGIDFYMSGPTSHYVGGGGVYVYGQTPNIPTFTLWDGEISGNTALNCPVDDIYGYGHPVIIIQGGEIVENTSTITGTYGGQMGGHGGGLASTGEIVMYDGKINRNKSVATVKDEYIYSMAGGLWSHYFSGGFTMHGGEICDNEAEWQAGVDIASGPFTMNGGKISGNRATGNEFWGGAYGGGVSLGQTSAVFTMEGGEISGNITEGNAAENLEMSDIYGGAGVIVFSGKLILNGGKISDNDARGIGDGGGVYNHGGAVTQNGGKISGNIAAGNGGGIYNRKTLELKGGVIGAGITPVDGGVDGDPFPEPKGGEGNIAGAGGGGVYNHSGAFTVTGGAVSGNKAAQGGGIYQNSATAVGIKDAVIAGNKSTGNGGGIYIGGGNVSIADSGIAGNKTGGDGGGVWTPDLAKLTAGGTIFSDNKARSYNPNPPLAAHQTIHNANITGSTFSDNPKTGKPFKWAYNNYDVNYLEGIVVTFDKNHTGASEPEPAGKTVTLDEEYGTLATVTRYGYTFTGWYTEPAGGTEVVPTTVVTTMDPHTLYAHWTPITGIVVTFDKNHGDATEPNPASKTVTFDEAYGPLATTTRYGYNLAGWYTEPAGGTEVEPATSVTTAEPHTLYAHWTPVTGITVTFDKNHTDVAGFTGPDPASKTVIFDQEYGTLAAVTRYGYTFAGWYTEPAGGTKVEETTIVTTEDAHTLYAHWTPVSGITVTFDKNHSDITGFTEPDPANKTVTFGEEYGTLAEVTRYGYDFAGWYTEPAGGEKVETTTVVTNEDAHTLYAHWTPVSAVVTFDKNHSDLAGFTGPEPASKTVTFGEEYGALAEVTRYGHIFTGWYTEPTGGTKVEATTMVTTEDAHTLYAHWMPVTGITVTFDKNHKDTAGFTEPDPANTIVTFGDEYGTLAAVTRYGYTFAGWYTEPAGGEKVEATTVVTNEDAHTLYAHWTPVSGIAVTFDKNHKDTTGFTGPEPASKTVTFGEEYGTLATVTRTGYHFAGWYTEPDGGVLVTASSLVKMAEKHTLYARWTDNEYAIKYEPNGGTNPKDAPDSYEYGDQTKLPVPEKMGYVFSGWYTSAKFTGNAVTIVGPTETGDKLFYAKWTVNALPQTGENSSAMILSTAILALSGAALAVIAKKRIGNRG